MDIIRAKWLRNGNCNGNSFLMQILTENDFITWHNQHHNRTNGINHDNWNYIIIWIVMEIMLFLNGKTHYNGNYFITEIVINSVIICISLCKYMDKSFIITLSTWDYP